MQVSVKGRVKNTDLPKTQGLLPLFEAIVNSVDAIEDKAEQAGDHHIDVCILREPGLFSHEEGTAEVLGTIVGFEVTDDGVGFTDANFAAFNEADTQAKADRGGKGVGRFLWLKAFDRAEVTSVFDEGKGLARRSFEFSLATPDGIGKLRREPAEPGTPQRTTVRLLGFREDYEAHVPKGAETIGQMVVEYCLEQYVLGKMPRVTVHDQEAGEAIGLDAVFDGLVARTEKGRTDVDGTPFDITHFTLHAHTGFRHTIRYCADRRLVRGDPIAPGRIPDLPSRLADAETGASLVYAGCVASPYLDGHVNQERTGFHSVPEDGLPIPGELPWPRIEEHMLGLARAFLKPYTEEVRARKERQVEEYVDEHAPEYRPILRHHREALERIPVEASGKAIDAELHAIQREVEAGLRDEADRLLAEGALTGPGHPTEDLLERFAHWWDEYNEVGKANLARYIVQRKVVLEFLDRALRRDQSGGYPREEVIHRLIFPLRATSDDVTFEQHNLWVIDEKLAYHTYLASDIPLRGSSRLESEASSRPDLLLFFDRAIAVVDGDQPFNAGVVIFEFKRPMRDDYGESDNPFQQVFGYVDDIRSGRALTKDGRPINVSDATPFYCYIVCDLTERLKKQARHHGLKATPDGNGFYGHIPEVGCYVEVIGLDRLVQDANRRNRILFDKLNLPKTLGPPE